jgi:hypothetical protein
MILSAVASVREIAWQPQPLRLLSQFSEYRFKTRPSLGEVDPLKRNTRIAESIENTSTIGLSPPPVGEKMPMFWGSRMV